MKAKYDLRASIQYILERLEWIDQNASLGWHTGNSLADYNTFNSVLRDLHTLSEEVSKLPEDFNLLFPQIEWRKIAGFRNVIVQDFLKPLDPEIIRIVIQEKLPELVAVLHAHLLILTTPEK